MGPGILCLVLWNFVFVFSGTEAKKASFDIIISHQIHLQQQP